MDRSFRLPRFTPGFFIRSIHTPRFLWWSAKFPKLLPEAALDGEKMPMDHISLKDVLQSTRLVGSVIAAASSIDHLRTSDLPPSPDPSPEDAAHHGPSVAAGQGGCASVPVGTGTRVRSSKSDPVMPTLGFETLDSNALADLFECLGRLLRSGCREQRTA